MPTTMSTGTGFIHKTTNHILYGVHNQQTDGRRIFQSRHYDEQHLLASGGGDGDDVVVEVWTRRHVGGYS